MRHTILNLSLPSFLFLSSSPQSTNIITQVGGDPGLPENNFERLADFIVAFVAVFVVAVVIGNVTELVSELSAEEGERRAKLAMLNSFMFARRLPDDLQKRSENATAHSGRCRSHAPVRTCNTN
jgi:hypothetical protein